MPRSGRGSRDGISRRRKGNHAVRGHVAVVKGDPFIEKRVRILVDIVSGCVLIRDGVIVAVAPCAQLKNDLPDGTHVDHYPD